MSKSILLQVDSVYRRLLWVMFFVPLFLYAVTWLIEPYLFGFTVLSIGSLQVLWFLAGLVLMFTVSAKSIWSDLIYLVLMLASIVVVFSLLENVKWS